MTVNSYFRSNYTGSGEQTLIENLIIESIQARGLDMYYIPRENVDQDEFFGEDPSALYSTAYTLELYINSVDGFGGDNELLSKFGLEVQDELTFTVSRKRFDDEVTTNDSNIQRPREGDLIGLPDEVDHRKRVFEIRYVDDTEVFYQLGKLYTYWIRARVFSFSNEQFDTGISDVDDLSDQYASAISIILASGSGTYQAGETVTQTGGWGAEVLSYDSNNDELVVINQTGTFDSGENIVGDTSGASWSVDKIDDEFANEDIEDNTLIDNEDDSFIDTTKNNLFS